MSSEELRAHLFRTLQERGVLDSVKVLPDSGVCMHMYVGKSA